MGTQNLRILFLSHKFHPDVGGIEVNSEVLASQFAKLGHSVKLVTWTESYDKKEFPFEVYRNPGILHLIKLHRWAEVVFENNPCIRLSWPRAFYRRPGVIALRTWISRADGSLGFIDKVKMWWLSKASGVIAVSNEVRILTWPKAKVIGNPYRNEMFRIKNHQSRPPHFVFLGRLVSDKGVDVAIRTLSKLVTDHEILERDDFRLTIVGSGSELEQLKALTESLSLCERVDFTGSVTGEALVDLLNKHRFLLVPSLWKEPFGNVVLEGMACGCLPFVSNHGGLPDAVGVAGVTFDPHDHLGLYTSIKNIIINPDVERVLKTKAAQHLKNHTPEKVANRYLDVIKESLKGQ